MTTEVNIERDVRLALGDLTLQLIVARAEAADLREQLANAPKDKPNGKAKEAKDGPGDRPQPN